MMIVTAFAKKTGDYDVLSVTDVHILALTYELECELNHGDWRLLKEPGSVYFDSTPLMSRNSEGELNHLHDLKRRLVHKLSPLEQIMAELSVMMMMIPSQL